MTSKKLGKLVATAAGGGSTAEGVIVPTIGALDGTGVGLGCWIGEFSQNGLSSSLSKH
jgi:hypothetical protein